MIAFAGLLAAVACSREDASDLREWSPADHDHQSNPGATQVDTEKRKAEMPDLTKHGINDVVLVAWKQNCVPCHGVIGRGDGPRGRPLHPPDFTNPGWQRVRIDSEMEHTIKNGKGQMPAFGSLPDTTVKGLVQLVRMLNPERVKEGSEKADQDGTPEGKVAPTNAVQAKAAEETTTPPAEKPAP